MNASKAGGDLALRKIYKLAHYPMNGRAVTATISISCSFLDRMSFPIRAIIITFYSYKSLQPNNLCFVKSKLGSRLASNKNASITGKSQFIRSK